MYWRNCSKCGKQCRGVVCVACIQASKKRVHDKCLECGAPVSLKDFPTRCKKCAIANKIRNRVDTYVPPTLYCEWCKKVIPWKKAYRWNPARFCCRSCSSYAHQLAIGHTKAPILARATEYITRMGRYCELEEVCKNTHTAEKTFRAWDICVPKLNNQLGYYLCDTEANRLKLEAVLASGAAEGCTNLREVAAAAGVSYDAVKGKRIGINALLRKAGVAHNLGKYRSREQLETAAVEYLKTVGHIVPMQPFLRALQVDFYRWKKLGCDLTRVRKAAGLVVLRTASHYEQVAALRLELAGFVVVKQKRFDDLRSPITNYPLRCDLYLSNANILIEVDGQQHSDTSHCYWKPNLALHDETKEAYARVHNIPLYHLAVTPAETFEQRLAELIDTIKSGNSKTSLTVDNEPSKVDCCKPGTVTDPTSSEAPEGERSETIEKQGRAPDLNLVE